MLAVEVVAIVLSVAIGLIENILTSEKHPAHALVYGLASLAILSAALQAVDRIRAAKKEVQSDSDIREIKSHTSEILDINRTSQNRAEEEIVDRVLAGFPAVLRSAIKDHWTRSPQYVGRVIESVGEPTTRPLAVLKEWEQTLPEWLASSDWRAMVVAAELAQAYGANRLAVELWLKAAPASTRTQYWTARASLMLYLEGQTQAADRVLAERGINLQSADLFARIVFSLVADEHASTRVFLDEWEPEEPVDIFLSGRVQIALIFPNANERARPTGEQYRQAAAVYRRLMTRLPYSTASRVGLASSLIGLVDSGLSINRHRDLDEALEQAIVARGLARDNRSSSVQAVEIACQAAYSDMQFRRTINIGTTITGEASIEEASSDIVRTLVANAALVLGERALADRLILEIGDPFRRSIIVALSAESEGRPSADLWNAALQEARDADERAQVLLGLARLGLAEPTDVESLRRERPQLAALIQAVSAAASGNLTTAIQQLRSLQYANFNAVAALAETYLQAGNVTSAADALREGARILNEPRLRVEAARLLDQNEHHDDAVAELEALLIDSASNSALRHDCLGILAEWAAERNDWPRAQVRFRELLALDPSDSKARWALILVLLHRGLVADARQVYDDAPTVPNIVFPVHARAWMAIRSPSDRVDGSGFVNSVIDVANDFPDDEDVQADAIFTVLSPDSRDSAPLPSATQARFDNLFYHFTEAWPQSTRFRRFTANDIQGLVSQMEELVRPTQEEKRLRTEIADQLVRNTLPWAVLSAITGRSYSEIVVVRAGGVLPARATDLSESQICRETARAAIDKSVVLDISAAGVLIEIPELANRLTGHFDRLMISEQERLDVITGEFALRGRSTSSWIYDEQSDRGRLATITTEEAEERHRRVTELLNLIKRCVVTPIAPSERIKEMGELAGSAWVTTIECAAQSQASLWCDDVALRAAARSIGVPAFSTPALIDVLVEAGVLTSEERERAVRAFIEGFIGDFPLDQIRLSVLTAKYDGAAIPVCTVFSRTSSWANFVEAYKTWCVLVQQSVSVDHKHAPDWLYYAILGFGRTQAVPRLRTEAAAMLLSAAVSFVSNDPNEVARCVVAARAGLTVVAGEALSDDPLPRAVIILRTSLAILAGIVNATSHVSRAFGTLQEADRQTVLQALYGQ
jgi:DNA-binding SARP family transcriptional activator